MPLKRTTAVLRLAFIALAAAPGLGKPISIHAPRDGISWGKCNGPISEKVECAKFTVPIDWDAADSGVTLTLDLVRLLRPSNSTAKRIGTLFINPGGPGASPRSTIGSIANGFINATEIVNSFDLMGVAPRGVGIESESICDPDIWNERVSLFPKTREEYDRMVDKNKRLGESCLKLTGDSINYQDTISVAKDHEAVRKAIGEEMNWLGLSYGTQLGAQYAQLFPNNIRAMVLDGMLQHSQGESSNILIETTAYSAALKSFFEWAGTNDESPLKGLDVEKLWYTILEKAKDKPIPVPDCEGCHKDVTEEEIRLNAQGLLLSARTGTRVSFAEALQKANEGNAIAFASSFATEFGRFMYPGITIGCQDWSTNQSSFEDFQAKMRMAEVFAPLTKGASQTWTLQASCIGWPTPLKNPPAKLNVRTKEPILMVNSLRDPSTSYVWAIGMLDEIENSVLLTRDGDGHTSWDLGGATTKAINHFLLTKELPEPGTVLDS